MKIEFSIIVLLLTLITTVSFAQNNSSRLIYQKLKLCKKEGMADSVLCGTFPVYENRQTNSGRLINLNIMVIPAVHPETRLSPIFYIEGGPGVPATGSASFYADTVFPYRQYRDIVLIDARGTGGSNPLNCSSLQSKAGLKEQFDDMYPIQSVKACFDSLSKQADLSQYTTTNVVNDLEEARKWLGYEKINLLGLSYGSRVSLVYMKLFPSVVESCVLWSPTPTYSKLPLYLAKFTQNTLEQVFDTCKNNAACNTAFPGLKNEFNILMKRVKKKPLEYLNSSATGHAEKLTISWNAFETKIRSLSYTPGGLRKIPFIVHETYKGNLHPFISLYPKGRSTNNFIAEGFYLCVTCAEDVPFITENEIDSLTKETFMGTYRIDQQKAACANWVQGKIPAGFFDKISSDIPTLILSGGYDPVTPLSVAAEISIHLPNSKLVQIPQMSHISDGLSHEECLDFIIMDFINHPMNKQLNIHCINEMLPGPYLLKEKTGM